MWINKKVLKYTQVKAALEGESVTKVAERLYSELYNEQKEGEKNR